MVAIKGPAVKAGSSPIRLSRSGVSATGQVGRQQCVQPAESVPEQPGQRTVEVLLIEGNHGRNTLEVFGAFRFDDGDDIVDGDDSQQTAFAVHQRQGQEIVPR